MQNTREKGYEGELVALLYLKAIGYLILKRNVYVPGGELDLIVKDTSTLVFVEVKYVTQSFFCNPVELFSKTKQSRMKRAVFQYLYRTKPKNFSSYRLDLVCITKEPDKFWIEHYKNLWN